MAVLSASEPQALFGSPDSAHLQRQFKVTRPIHDRHPRSLRYIPFTPLHHLHHHTLRAPHFLHRKQPTFYILRSTSTSMTRMGPISSPLPSPTTIPRYPASPSASRSNYVDHYLTKPHSPINKNKFRPVDFQTQVEVEKFFGQTKLQKRQLALHTKDEDGRWWFDGIEREENRSLLGPASPQPPGTSRRGSQLPSIPSTPSLHGSFDGARRRSSTNLLSSLAPLQVATPDRADFFQPHGILTSADDSHLVGADDTPLRRTRMKRSHSACGRGNVIGDKLPDITLQGAMGHVTDLKRKDHDSEAIRLPAFLPLPHRLVSSKDLDDAFHIDREVETTTAPFSSATATHSRKDTSVSFADDINPPRSRSGSGNSMSEIGMIKKNRPRPARLDLTPRRGTGGGGGGEAIERLASASGTDPAAMALQKSTSSGASSVPGAVAIEMSSSGSNSSSGGTSPTSLRKRSRPWSTYEMSLSPAVVTHAFNAVKETMTSPVRARRDDRGFSPETPVPPPSSAGAHSSAYSPSPFSPIPLSASCRSPRGRMRSYSLDQSPIRSRYSPSSPISPVMARARGAAVRGLTGGTLEASKGEQLLGANPLNRNLLAPGGLATGEGVYDGLIIPCASVHLGSDDEDDEEGEKKGDKPGRATMKKWLSRSKSAKPAGATGGVAVVRY